MIDEVQCFGDPKVARTWSLLQDSEESYGNNVAIPILLDVDPHAAYGTTSLGETMMGRDDWRPDHYTEFEQTRARIIAIPRH